MSTATMTGPRIAAPPRNTDQAEVLAGLIAAKNALLSGWQRLLAAPRAAWSFLKSSLHLQGAVDLVKSATAPAVSMAKSVIHLVGIPEMTALLVSTRTGQSILKHTVGRAARWTGKGVGWLYNGALWTISLVSESAAINVDSWICDKVVQPVMKGYVHAKTAVLEFADPASNGMRSIQAIALFTSALRITRHFLPKPWNWVVMVVTTLVLADRYKDVGSDLVDSVLPPEEKPLTDEMAASVVTAMAAGATPDSHGNRKQAGQKGNGGAKAPTATRS